MLNVYLMVAIAAVANVATVYFLKLSAGLTVPWPIFGMLIANLFTNWFLGRAFATGAPVGGAVTMLVVGVMVGSLLVGLAFGERIAAIQGVGAAIAIVGVIVCNLAPRAP
jgi:multidrug transporter EmrE-like cation transporter